MQREKEFEERDAEIWPKKPALKPSKKSYQPQQSQQQSRPSKNKSLVNENPSDKRDYSKPWLANANKKKPGEEEKKSFMKSVYPDGAGPDADLISMLEREVVDLTPNVSFDDIAEL